MAYLLTAVFLSLVCCSWCVHWPIGQDLYKTRPKVDRFCDRALFPFCPTGYSNDSIPIFDHDDTIELYVLKAPVWEFKFGRLLADFHIIHDAIGIKSVKTGRNFTTEWYELFQLFNCTFPHLTKSRTSPVWCNQGAACVYPGIDDKHWSENGTLLHVTTMTGTHFNSLSDYIKEYNNTYPFYETWRVRNSTDTKHYQEWFKPCDCATYVQKVFCLASQLGARFNDTYEPKYTFITLISDEPIKLGNKSDVFDSGKDPDLAKDIIKFYLDVQAHQSTMHLIESLLSMLQYVMVEKKFYLFYNNEYWQLPMKEPYVKLSYETVSFNHC